MSMFEVAQRLREEHDRVDDLSDRLREHVCVVPRTNIGHWIDIVHERFEHFRAHFTQHMALEEQEGYMVSVVENRPTLSIEVDRLKHEHREIVKIMDRIHVAVEQLDPNDRLLVYDCCRRIDNLLNYVEHHENDENLLITFAYTHDIGTKD